MRPLIHEVMGYGVASAAALIVDMGILWLLVDRFGCGYLAAATISFLAGAAVAYLLSVRLAFTNHRLRDRRAEFLAFVALGTAGVAVNAGVIAFAVRYLGLHYLLAKCFAAVLTFSCNFVLRRQLLFVGNSPA